MTIPPISSITQLTTDRAVTIGEYARSLPVADARDAQITALQAEVTSLELELQRLRQRVVELSVADPEATNALNNRLATENRELRAEVEKAESDRDAALARVKELEERVGYEGLGTKVHAVVVLRCRNCNSLQDVPRKKFESGKYDVHNPNTDGENHVAT